MEMAVEGACRPAQLALPRRAYDFVGDVEERVESDPAAVPHPDGAVAASVAEVLQNVVGGLDRLPPRA